MFMTILLIVAFSALSVALTDYRFSNLQSYDGCIGYWTALDLTKSETYDEINVVQSWYRVECDGEVLPNYTSSVTIGSCTGYITETDNLVACEYTRPPPYPEHRLSVACYNNETVDWECKITYLDDGFTIKDYPFNMTKIERTTVVTHVLSTTTTTKLHGSTTALTTVATTTPSSLAMTLIPYKMLFAVTLFLSII